MSLIWINIFSTIILLIWQLEFLHFMHEDAEAWQTVDSLTQLEKVVIMHQVDKKVLQASPLRQFV